MLANHDTQPAARDALTRLAKSGDRSSPLVFAGREAEIDLLNDAVMGVQNGEAGRTVVVQGVPGAGKTALLNEYAARLLTTAISAEKTIIPVPMLSRVVDEPPVAIVQEIDRWFRKFEASDEWRRKVNRAVGGVSLAAKALFAAMTKKNLDDFRTSAKSPNSLDIALEDYVRFRFDRHESIVVLLVDEAQNLNDTKRVRGHLEALHGGVGGGTRLLLACFGLENTVNRLRELGLSRLAQGHARTIGALSDEDAERTVMGTLTTVLSQHIVDFESFDEVQRHRWIHAAATTILSESANFPHHLANGCRAFAQIVLDEGIGDMPPVEKLREQCRNHKREYYDARLRPWDNHKTALAYAFGSGGKWVQVGDVKRVLMASDEFGDPVDAKTATNVLKEMCAHGYVENRHGACRPVLPSLTSHFKEVAHASALDNEVERAIRAALPIRFDQNSGE